MNNVIAKVTSGYSGDPDTRECKLLEVVGDLDALPIGTELAVIADIPRVATGWVSVQKQLPVKGQLVAALLDNRKNFQACVLADVYKQSKLSTIYAIYGGTGADGQLIWAHLFPRANKHVSDSDRITMWVALPEMPIALLNSTEYHKEHQLSRTDIVGYGL